MELIIGGAYQGKLAYVLNNYHLQREQAVFAETGTIEELYRASVIYGFHLFIRNCLKEQKDPYKETEKLLEKNPSVILIADEIGYGIVPMDAFEREYRETTGRVLCEAVKKAERVTRVVCGIGMVIA